MTTATPTNENGLFSEWIDTGFAALGVLCALYIEVREAH
jgi:hypothetical protein